MAFVGFNITMDHVKPSKKLLLTIAEYPIPQNIADARGFFGVLQQGNYAASIQEHMHPFRDFLKAGVVFEWSDDLMALF